MIKSWHITNPDWHKNNAFGAEAISSLQCERGRFNEMSRGLWSSLACLPTIYDKIHEGTAKFILPHNFSVISEKS